MKTLKSLLYVFLAAFLFVGCNDDENFNPGEPEDPDCYSVYFPTQENIGSKELDPAAPTEMTFTVRRLKSEGAIVVPVAVTSSEEGIFVPSQIEFADGQEETTVPRINARSISRTRSTPPSMVKKPRASPSA